MPTLPAVPAEPDRLPGEPTPELTSVSWETVYGPAVYTEPFKASSDLWRRQEADDAEERARLIKEIERQREQASGDLRAWLPGQREAK